MIKRILLTIVMLLLIAYLVAAVTVFNSKPAPSGLPRHGISNKGYAQCRFRH